MQHQVFQLVLHDNFFAFPKICDPVIKPALGVFQGQRAYFYKKNNSIVKRISRLTFLIEKFILESVPLIHKAVYH